MVQRSRMKMRMINQRIRVDRGSLTASLLIHCCNRSSKNHPSSMLQTACSVWLDSVLERCLKQIREFLHQPFPIPFLQNQLLSPWTGTSVVLVPGFGCSMLVFGRSADWRWPLVLLSKSAFEINTRFITCFLRFATTRPRKTLAPFKRVASAEG